MTVSLRQVEVFVALADTLHFGRAADRLHIAQATVSQELKRLELGLGLRLFARSTRTARLTPAGEALLPDARGLLAAAQNLEERARLFQSEHLRRVRIVASPSAMNKLIPAVIRQAEQALPDAEIEDVAAESGAVVAEMQRLGSDIGVGRFLAVPPRHRKEVLVDEQYFAVLSIEHPLAARESVALSELEDLPLLMWSREQSPDYYDALLAICRDRGLHPMVLVSPPRIVGTRIYLLAEQRAFSLIPASAVEFLPAEVRAVPLDQPASLPLEMIYREDDPREGVQAMIALIRATASDTMGQGVSRGEAAR